jgi:hypothetical protein
VALIRLYMALSLDGYVAGPQDGVDAPMGVGGFRLFNWLDRRDEPGPSGTAGRAARRVGTARRTGPARTGAQAVRQLPAERVELDLIRRLTTPDVEPAQRVMHVRYRIRAFAERASAG